MEGRVERGRLAVVDELVFVAEKHEHPLDRLHFVLAHRLQEDLQHDHNISMTASLPDVTITIQIQYLRPGFKTAGKHLVEKHATAF